MRSDISARTYVCSCILGVLFFYSVIIWDASRIYHDYQDRPRITTKHVYDAKELGNILHFTYEGKKFILVRPYMSSDSGQFAVPVE